MKKATKIIVLIAILFALIFIVLPLVLYSGNYSGAILIAIPFGIGLVFALLVCSTSPVTGIRIRSLSLIPIVLIVVSCFVIAGEGAICFIIMGVVLLIPYYFGIAFGYLIQEKVWVKNTSVVVTLLFILTSFNSLPEFGEDTIIKDEIVINASKAEVWQNLIQPVVFGESDNFFFRNGVSYPNAMHLKKSGEHLILSCDYNNGKINASIIEFSPSNYFSFTFNDSLISMQEKNLYKESQTMHLQNHFVINYGKFEVAETDSLHCKLIASTSYKQKFKPEFYTDFWVSYFVHNLHKHVLNAIELKSELKNKPTSL